MSLLQLSGVICPAGTLGFLVWGAQIERRELNTPLSAHEALRGQRQRTHWARGSSSALRSVVLHSPTEQILYLAADVWSEERASNVSW